MRHFDSGDDVTVAEENSLEALTSTNKGSVCFRSSDAEGVGHASVVQFRPQGNPSFPICHNRGLKESSNIVIFSQ